MGQAAAGATGVASAGGGLAGAASAAMPWVSLGLGAANIATGLVEASKQKELQRAADREAEKAAAEQERLLGQNFFEALQVPMQAYDREFRETTAQQQQAMSALQEGDPRLLLGGVGKVQAVAAEQEAKTREALGQDLFNLGKLQANEAGQTADQLAALEGQRLAGAQEASAAARAASLQQQQSALAAGGKLLTGLTGMIPEYSKTKTPGLSGTGSEVFNKFMNYQQPQTSQLGIPQLAPAPQASIGFGKSAFQPNQFAAVSMPDTLGYLFNTKS
jgi:hypothetical protein